MSDRLDLRKILFRNKKEAKSLLEKISRALTAKDGVSNIFVYGNYRIRLLTQIGGVFMIVEEKGLTQSTLRISKENYEQINMT